jgi:hypothetical protein
MLGRDRDDVAPVAFGEILLVHASLCDAGRPIAMHNRRAGSRSAGLSIEEECA